MSGIIDRLLGWMAELPAGWIYALSGGLAALENVFPPVPADVVALFGGFLAGRGSANPVWVFVLVWLCNVGGAMLVYEVGRRYGARFFEGKIGRMLLKPGQVDTLSRFYDERGAIVIFISRFLPMFRAVVPVFAGTSGLSRWRTLLPLAAASALWYGGLVYLGATAGENWTQVRSTVEASGKWFLIAAALLGAAVAFWWWRSRSASDAG